ncbi:MAG: hypothetical protein JO154_23515 [Chitinophaga sp.]|uniref:hypothetical protein n=1 Tax=Chitinophaga sp. TaxID=1869181 RepID=UPI0025C3FC5D|nr:hypothetical protein [Chitinophaga sp.]MBV8255583.1 hypothetical protein [Chitinophaga sp.]
MLNEERNKLFLQQAHCSITLRDLEERNVYLKMKLARVLANNLERDQLAFLEAFQNRFLKHDGQITLLKHEVNELYMMINDLRDTNQLNAVAILREGIYNRINRTQLEFENLNADFSNYLVHQFPGI